MQYNSYFKLVGLLFLLACCLWSRKLLLIFNNF